MAVYRMMKGCKGCEIRSGYQKDHSHFILDSVEYEEGKRILFIAVIIGFIMSILFLLLLYIRNN